MNIPTAEEFARREYDDNSHIDEFMERQVDMKHAIWMIQEFAKLHIKATLKAASEKAEIDIDDNGGTTVTLDKNSILNAYPLTNIK